MDQYDLFSFFAILCQHLLTLMATFLSAHRLYVKSLYKRYLKMH